MQCRPHHWPGASAAMDWHQPALLRKQTAPVRGCDRREYQEQAWARMVYSCPPSNGFNQHGTTLPATDALGGDATLVTEALHGIDQVQHDAVATGADRVTGADCASVHVETIPWNSAGRRIKAERIAAELRILPGGQAAQDLRSKGFVQLPQLDVIKTKVVPLHERNRAIDWTEPHDRWVERRPFAINDDSLRCEIVLLDGVFRR